MTACKQIQARREDINVNYARTFTHHLNTENYDSQQAHLVELNQC